MARAIRRPLVQSLVAMAPGAVSSLLVVVQRSSGAGSRRTQGQRTGPSDRQYGHLSADWRARRQAMDLYQLGSLLLFLFTGVATTPALGTYLFIDQYPQDRRDSYDDVLP